MSKHHKTMSAVKQLCLAMMRSSRPQRCWDIRDRVGASWFMGRRHKSNVWRLRQTARFPTSGLHLSGVCSWTAQFRILQPHTVKPHVQIGGGLFPSWAVCGGTRIDLLGGLLVMIYFVGCGRIEITSLRCDATTWRAFCRLILVTPIPRMRKICIISTLLTSKCGQLVTILIYGTFW